MTAPWLSVLMPTYNGERYLRETFASLLVQDDRDFECVVVDGGSTDSTLGIIEEFSRELDVRLFIERRFPNWIGKTNLALTRARAKHACMLHHDDLWHAGRAAKVRAVLERNPDTALVLHPSTLIGGDGAPLGQWSCPLLPDRRYAPAELLERLLVQNFISVPSPTFRVDSALSVGGIDEHLWYTGDWDFYLKLAALGPTLYIDEPLSSFRLHASSLTVTGSANSEDFRHQLATVLERHIGSIADDRARRRIRRAAEASNGVNAALAAALHGSYSDLPFAIASVVALGPSGWRRYFRDSRIVERLSARIRARRTLRDLSRKAA